MEKQFDYNESSERWELIQWIQCFSKEEWMRFQNLVFDDKYKKDFTYDERNCLKVVRNFNYSYDVSPNQFKMINWAHNIVQRIEGLITREEIINNQNNENEDNRNTPLRHLTLRVAWHDNNWNGTVCNNPDKNIFCNGYHSLLSDRIRREKEKLLPSEMIYAGKPVEVMINEVDKFPPCFWSINIFGEKSIKIKHFNPAAPHLKPIEEELPSYSMFSWPFSFSFVRNTEEYKSNGKYPFNLGPTRIPRFRSKIKNNETIGFIYAKYSNPLSYEDMKYLIIGCGKINEKGNSTQFGPQEEIEKIKNKKIELRNFPDINWAIRFSFDPKTIIRMPYHEYIIEAQRRSLDEDQTEKLLNKIRVTIDEQELEHCFKYVAMDIDDDEAIFILTKMRAKLLETLNDGIVDARVQELQIKRTEELLEYCWNRRTHFPGFRNLARNLLDKNENENCRLDDFINNIKEIEPDYCQKIKELLNDPKSDSEYINYKNELLQLKKVLIQLEISIEHFLILSMLNLSPRQFEKIKMGQISDSEVDLKQICENPYLLFEEYKVDKDPQDPITGEFIDFPIELFKIDIALFPNIDYLNFNYLQENLNITDPRRIRALIIQHLKAQELTTGNCFDDAKNIQNKLGDYPLFYKLNSRFLLPEFFLEKSDNSFDRHLSHKLEIVIANDSKYYYLKQIFTAEKGIADFIQSLLNIEEPNALQYSEIENYLNKSTQKMIEKIGDSFDKEAFCDERRFLYENIFPKKFFVLCGSPGTGKSYEILNVIKYLKENSETNLLLAPTGKAVLRLKLDEDFKDLNIDAMTIDKFIYLWKNKPNSRKAYNNIIIDEMSMVDLKKFDNILKLFDPCDPSFHRLILVGDPHQLPPIGFGKPFCDIIKFLESNTDYNNNIVDLDVNCRQELEKNEILDFSKLFSNEGDLSNEQLEKITKGGKISEGFEIFYWNNNENLVETLQKVWISLAEDLKIEGTPENKLDGLFDIRTTDKTNPINYNLDRFQIITPYRFYSDKVNLYYQSVVRNNEEIDILKLFKNKDKIIRTQNYYKDDDLILSNGSIGLAIKHKKSKLLYFSELKDNFLSIYGDYGIREREKEFFELAYCITVHKSQGSGFDHLIVILPKKYGLLCKELFYTALTRSKKSIVILVEGDPGQDFDKSLFEFARRRSYTESRKTSLMLDYPNRFYGLEPEPGIFVQSRVEQIIYRHLVEFRDKLKEKDGFDFKYEQFPIIDDQKIRIKTDFTIFTKKGKYYWEHLGRLSKRSYKKKWMNLKKPTYEKFNLLEKLITTDELNGISDNKISQIIQSIIDGNIGNEDKYKKYSNHHFSLR